MPLNFAKDTECTPTATRAEIETVFVKAGAEQYAFAQNKTEGRIAFEHHGRRYRFRVELPTIGDPLVINLPDGSPRQYQHRANARIRLERMRWRTMLLGIKARLAEVECGVSTFEQAFLAETILPTGRTVYEEVNDRVSLAYQGADVPLLDGPR